MARKAATTQTKAKKKEPKQKFYWHFMRNDGTLGYQDERKPKLGQWITFKPDKHLDRDYSNPHLCGHGMHAVATIKDCLDWAAGLRITRVELGKIYESDQVKSVSDKRRILEVWTGVQVRKTILALARERATNVLKDEMQWWLKNCPFEEVRKAIRAKDITRFQEYKQWLSPDMDYNGFGPPGFGPPPGYMERFMIHPIYDRSRKHHNLPDQNFLDELASLEKAIKTDPKMTENSGREMLRMLFRRDLTQEEFLKKLGAGRKAKNIKK